MVTVTDRRARRETDREPDRASLPVPDVRALQEELAELAGVVNAAQGRMVELVAQALEEGWWAQEGLRSPVHWVCWRLGCSLAHAHRLVGLARRSTELAETTAALSAGEVSLDQASVVARHVPAAHDRAAAELARRATVSQLSRTLSRYHFGDEAGDGSAPRRSVASWTDGTGQWRLRAELPADEGALVDRALWAACTDLTDDRDPTDPEGTAVRPSLADGFVAVAETSLSAGHARRPGAGRHTVLAHLEADPTRPTGPGVLGVHLGARLPDVLRRLITCDTTIRPIWERHGTPVSVGRSQRIVPDRVRRLVERRDGQCVVPGCEHERWLEIHHVVHWEDGGTTDTYNLVALCPAHHRAHHHGLVGITGDADRGVTVTDRHGRPLDHTAKPRPPNRPLRGPRYRPPSGERLDPHQVVLHRRLPDRDA